MTSNGPQLTLQEAERSKSIVSKCGGLPKVITVIGEVYRYFRFVSPRLEDLSDNFMGTLETDPRFHGLRPLFSWMQSYFDACSDSLKPCIFYLSIFPPAEKKNIRRRRLLCRWIAEGYCRDTSDGKTCEENGEDYMADLVDLSIIQWLARSASYQQFVELDMNKVFCQINGFFHEYIISRPMEDNLVFALEKGCSLNSARGGQHLTIRSSWDRRDMTVYESIDFSRLRSLTVFGKWESFFIYSSKNVNMMRLLRVLDLEDATHVENKDLEQIAKLLPRLKFLSLRGHRKINCLPISMGGLRQLQTLDIRGTSIVTLPLFITKLQKLRYIRAGTITSESWDWEGGDVVSADGEEEDRASSSAQAVTNLAPPVAAATPKQGDVVSADGEEENKASSSAQALTNLPPPPAATPKEGDVISADGVEENKASSSAQELTNLPPPAATTPKEGDVVSADGEENKASSSAQAVTNLASPAAAATPREGGIDTTTRALPLVSRNNRPSTPNNLVFSLLSKLCRSRGGLHNNEPAAGVKVPAGIQKLAVLHTLGVVNVSNVTCSAKPIFFEDLKKLRQLRKLGVSGINKGNISGFCEAISHHAHLKSLSVEVDKDADLDDYIPRLPKTIHRLKLYGRAHKLLDGIMFQLSDSLKTLKLDLTIEKPEELPALYLLCRSAVGHVRIRPIQDGDLLFQGAGWNFAQVVEIQCSSALHLKFHDHAYFSVELLKVHFSGGSQSSLQISGLSELTSLKEVWLKGYTDAHRQYMQRQINKMRLNEGQARPVLKLVQPCSP